MQAEINVTLSSISHPRSGHRLGYSYNTTIPLSISFEDAEDIIHTICSENLSGVLHELPVSIIEDFGNECYCFSVECLKEKFIEPREQITVTVEL